MRFVVAKRHGRRGEGLGNEILPWAKGWIASQALDARLVGPSWGVNRRRYYRNFGTPRLDFLVEDALRHLPHHAFTEQDYRATGQIDFGSAIKKWATTRGLKTSGSYILSVEGMWGGYPSIRTARAFLLAKLLNSRDALRNVYQVTSALDRKRLFVAVHIRSANDGFVAPCPGESVRGIFNIFIPGEWYLWVCERLHQQFGERIQFYFFTDRRNALFDEAVRRFNPGQIVQQGLTECSDLLLMTQADLRICSVSSYSLAANFLSGGPYLWYEPQLTLSHGLYTLWGNETSNYHRPQGDKYPTNIGESSYADPTSSATFMGTAMDIGDPLPTSLVRLLDQRLSGHDPRTNLIEYGSVPKLPVLQTLGCTEPFTGE